MAKTTAVMVRMTDEVLALYGSLKGNNESSSDFMKRVLEAYQSNTSASEKKTTPDLDLATRVGILEAKVEKLQSTLDSTSVLSSKKELADVREAYDSVIKLVMETKNAYLKALRDACPLDKWEQIVAKAIEQAIAGDKDARDFLAKYAP